MCWGSLPTTQGWCTLPDQTQPCVMYFVTFLMAFEIKHKLPAISHFEFSCLAFVQTFIVRENLRLQVYNPRPILLVKLFPYLVCVLWVVMLWHFADISSRTTESFTKQSSGEIDLFHTHSHVIGKPSEQTIVVARHACNQVYREVGRWMEGDVMFFHSFSVYFFFVSFCDLSAICIEFYHHTMTVELYYYIITVNIVVVSLSW